MSSFDFKLSMFLCSLSLSFCHVVSLSVPLSISLSLSVCHVVFLSLHTVCSFILYLLIYLNLGYIHFIKNCHVMNEKLCGEE